MKRIEGLLDSEVLDAHFRLFAAMISGAAQSEYETGELPKRGQMIFPAQCWKDVVCAKVLSRVLQTHRAMVVTGSGHTDFGLGVPSRTRALLTQQDPLLASSLDEVIITTRAVGEMITRSFRGRELCDLLFTYKPAA